MFRLPELARAKVPPAAIGPVTERSVPLFMMKPAAEKPVIVATRLAPGVTAVRLAAPVEAPDSEPAISVPLSVIAPLLATRETAPAPPSVTVPGIAIDALVRLMAVALTIPEIVNAALSTIVAKGPPLRAPAIVRLPASFRVKPEAVNAPIVATWLVTGVAPVREVAPLEPPERVPAISVPVSLIGPQSRPAGPCRHRRPKPVPGWRSTTGRGRRRRRRPCRQ